MYKKVISLIPAFLALGCMVAIFTFSSQNSLDTTSLSLGFTSKVARKIFSEFDMLDWRTQNIMTEQLNHFIRKTAHFTLYCILGIMSSAYVYILSRKYIKSFVYGVAVCMIYAVIDEIHQMYVPGRTPLVTDVLIDTAGGVTGVLICFLMISALVNIRMNLSCGNCVQQSSS